jgi:hypothetical protein
MRRAGARSSSRARAAALARALAAAAALGPAGLALSAQEADPSFLVGGSARTAPFARISFAGGGSAAYGSASAIGLDLDARGPSARAYASVEAALLTGAAASDAWAARAVARAAGLDEGGLLLVPAYDSSPGAPPTLLEARIRSLYVKLDLDWMSLTAGRQVLKYQRCRLWSPTDAYTELDLSGLSPVRRGADALRLSFPLGATGGLDLAAAPGADPAEGRYSARLSGLVAGVDAAAIAFRDGAAASPGADSWSAGASAHADLGLGLDAEAIATRADSGELWARAALGADWSFGDFVLAAEYYYNGGGAAADRMAPGSHNAYAAISWKAGDFVAVNAASILGLSARSWSATLSASIDAAQNAAVEAYARIAAVDSGEPPALEAGAALTVKF